MSHATHSYTAKKGKKRKPTNFMLTKRITRKDLEKLFPRRKKK